MEKYYLGFRIWEFKVQGLGFGGFGFSVLSLV